MKSSRHVDQWLNDCNFLHNSPQSTMCFMYLNLGNVFEFLQKLLKSKRFWWNLTFLMMNILSRSLIRKKEALVERLLKCIKFNGIITLKKKLPGKLKVISINIIRVFSILSQVSPSICLPSFIQSRDEILFKGGRPWHSRCSNFENKFHSEISCQKEGMKSRN